MVKNMKRAFRRAMKSKIGKRVFKYYHGDDQEWNEKLERKNPGWRQGQESFYGNTKVPCSCDMCGNPRRSRLFNKKEKLTKQELIAIEKEKDDLNEIDDVAGVGFLVWHGPWDDEDCCETEACEFGKLMCIYKEDDNDKR